MKNDGRLRNSITRSVMATITLGTAMCLFTSVTRADEAATKSSADSTRPRLIIETDAGGDPDDEQSMVRFLVYANEWDVEGIIVNRREVRDGENLNKIRDGYSLVKAMVDAYGECHARLVEHDPRFPTREFLQKRTVSGYEDSDAGTKLVIEAVDRDDPRPVWFLNWGTDSGSDSSSLLRALDRVLAERGKDGYAKFKNKLRLSGYDMFGEHEKVGPPWKLWVHTFQPELDRLRWYHRFSGITEKAGGFDIERDVRRDHGPLGAMYPTNTTHRQKEGDTMTFMYLIPTGMNDPNEPTWGSWAGRYALRDDHKGKQYYWATAKDTLDGTTHRENTLKRWAADIQNDFRARMDWCVKSRGEANHPPQVVVQGKEGRAIVRIKAKPGETLEFSARGTKDPNDDSLVYQWFNYQEAGTYGRAVDVDRADTHGAKVVVPADAAGTSIHVVLRVCDNGEPPLAGYRRIVVDVQP
jgi:hypothetical protein